eukprot:181946_1
MTQYYNNLNNNKTEVNKIINTINSNMNNCLKLSNGNIILYENQLKLNNKNMEEVNHNLKNMNNPNNNLFRSLPLPPSQSKSSLAPISKTPLSLLSPSTHNYKSYDEINS